MTRDGRKTQKPHRPAERFAGIRRGTRAGAASMGRGRRLAAAVLALSLPAVLLVGPPANAAVGDVLLYTGNQANLYPNFSYVPFATAAGKGLTASSTLPQDLSAHPCVILPTNAEPFDADQKARLRDYVEDGGTLLALGENSNFLPGIATMNDLAASLPTGLSIVPAAIDGGFYVETSYLYFEYLTAGVSKFRYSATSRVAVNNPGVSLIGTWSGTTFVAATNIGDGTFLLSGDSNGFNDDGLFFDPTLSDNGRFAANLCGRTLTRIKVNPSVAEVDKDPHVFFPRLSARLFERPGGDAVSGATVYFTLPDGTPLCQATTSASGVAACGSSLTLPFSLEGLFTDLERQLAVLQAGGYRARFHGSTTHIASNGFAPVAEVFGNDVPPPDPCELVHVKEDIDVKCPL